MKKDITAIELRSPFPLWSLRKFYPGRRKGFRHCPFKAPHCRHPLFGKFLCALAVKSFDEDLLVSLAWGDEFLIALSGGSRDAGVEKLLCFGRLPTGGMP